MSEAKEPVLKKMKATKEESSDVTSDNTSAITPTEPETNQDGETFFDLTGKKRFTVRKWKGKVLLDVREFYENNGEMRPGKKGISLNLEQFKILR